MLVLGCYCLNKKIHLIAKWSKEVTLFTLLLLFPILFFGKNHDTESKLVMNRLYVNQAVAASGNGNSWATAYKELRDALDFAHTNSAVTEIWVAQGVYKPTDDLDPLISFVLKNDLSIYGGFLGNETNLSQRDWVANITTLSGDLADDDDYSTIPGINIEENSYHVIFNYYTYVNETAILDGFHIVGGNSSWNPPHHVGGGLYNKQASPAVYNCSFHDNRGGYGGGGIYVDSSAMIIQNSFIYDNVGVVRGGGFYNDASTFEITNCLIFNNKATRYDGTGGGIFNNFSSPVITNTTIANNSAAFQGGGIINNAWSRPFINNSIIWDNSDEIVNTSSSPNNAMPTTSITNNEVTIQNCIIKASGGSGMGWNPFYGIDAGNNLEDNPDFVDINGFNYKLTENSPAINSGNILLYPSGVPNDLDRNPRIYDENNGGIIDMGPFEYQGVTNNCNIGFPCNDNDPCTIGETYQANCDCSGGTTPDDDNDGVCDTDPSDNCIGPNVGDTCNDGNVNTFNDTVQSDCSCLGESNNPNACIPQINLAVGKPATQSSTSSSGGGGDASLAVDGNTNGDYWFGGSTSLTNWNNQTWWEIDLEEESNIEQINIFNRTDCCGEFLTEYYIFVSSTPFTSTDLNTTLNQSGVGTYFQNTIAGSPSQITINQSGRYVRIQLTGQGFIGLGEVQILGCTNGAGCPVAGTSCDDNNAATFDDIEDGNCNCEGTPCPTAGTTCDDGDPLTTNDVEDGLCNCSGTGCPATGTACDDNNPTTFDDIEDGNCNCVGTPCPTAGTTCDDGDPLTTNDIEDGFCNCSGTTIGCPPAGTSCNDNDPATFDDNEDGFCNCVGTPCPAMGTTCDDGDPLTINDMEDGFCNCSGEVDNNPGDCNSISNIALSKIATQSSTQFGAIAARAIDGNTDGNFWGTNSTSLTNWETHAWWELDLGAEANIESINIWGRTDCCDAFLNNYHVFISATPFTSQDLNTTLNQTGVTDFFQNSVAGTPSMIPVDISGRYIRIQLDGQAFLGIAELEVMGCFDGTSCPPLGTACNDNNPSTFNDMEDGNCICMGTPCPSAGTTCDDNNANTENDIEDGFCNCEGTPIGNNCTSTSNVALGKEVSQSSTLTVGSITGNPEKAIDGNTNGVFFISPSSASSVSATNNEASPFWEVDLDDDYFIENINIFNRTDGVDRSFDVYVLISNTPFTNGDLTTARTEASYEFFISGLVGSPSIISPMTNGQYVRIQMASPGYLVLAEVEVEGCLENTNNLVYPDLLDFKVRKEGHQSRLDWMTQQDTHVDIYEIEKSRDGLNFDFFQKINSQQLVVPHHYETIDAQPFYGDNFYRLKIVRLDGSVGYSKIRQVNFDIDFSKVQLYPNPTSSKIYLTLGDFAGQKGSIEIYNSLGQKMQQWNFESFPSVPRSFDVSQLVGGIYTISIQVENHRSFTKKFVVVRE